MKILCIYRDERFSPNSVENDKAILDAVSEKLMNVGHNVNCVNEDEWQNDGTPYTLVLTMGRRTETLARLSMLKCTVINTPRGIAGCARSRLQKTMERVEVPIPPAEGADGYWLKRGDGAAQSKNDVVFAGDKDALEEEKRIFEQRGIDDYTVSAHVRGDLVKFYGVEGTGFFRYYYPTDDGMTKFDHERHNGRAQHYPFDWHDMHAKAERLATAVGVAVYGGDCIVCKDGSWCMVDFNDWPSFSRCREDAAAAIMELIKKIG